MSTTTYIDAPELAVLLKQLLGRPVSVKECDAFEPHELTKCGLVDNDNQLVGVIAADLAFAHRSGASLAMIPAGAVEDAGDEVVDSWLEFYREVANVASRVVNEASPRRVRLDPGLEHSDADLDAVVGAGGLLSVEISIDGYGEGHMILGVNGV